MLSFLTLVTVFTILLMFADESQAISKTQQKQKKQNVAAASVKATPPPEPEETTTQAVAPVVEETVIAEETSESTVIDESKATDSCEWLPEKLTGRCWGLTNHHEVKGMQLKAHKVNNAMDCQKLCCDLGDQCATFQYIVGTKSCHVGPEVRLGKEKGKTDIWCDDVAPHKWNGHVLIHNRVGTHNLIFLSCLSSHSPRSLTSPPPNPPTHPPFRNPYYMVIPI